jgi:hypothetical protein
VDMMLGHWGNAAISVIGFLQPQWQGKFGTRRCIDVLIWLFLAPILLVVLGIPFFICIGSVVALFKKPRSVKPIEIESSRQLRLED